MISRVQGKVVKRSASVVILEIAGISYEILVPPAVMSSLESAITADGMLALTTYYYHQVDQNKAIPTLIGFLNEIEKDFFEEFITVSGIGPKAACRAMSMPFSVIAEAIDRSDIVLLKTLPGIGERRAREIVAKLQGKVSRFGLIRDGGGSAVPRREDGIREEAIEVLLQLQYRAKEAGEMVDKALARNQELATCEEILDEVYRQKAKK